MPVEVPAGSVPNPPPLASPEDPDDDSSSWISYDPNFVDEVSGVSYEPKSMVSYFPDKFSDGKSAPPSGKEKEIENVFR